MNQMAGIIKYIDGINGDTYVLERRFVKGLTCCQGVSCLILKPGGLYERFEHFRVVEDGRTTLLVRDDRRASGEQSESFLKACPGAGGVKHLLLVVPERIQSHEQLSVVNAARVARVDRSNKSSSGRVC